MKVLCCLESFDSHQPFNMFSLYAAGRADIRTGAATDACLRRDIEGRRNIFINTAIDKAYGAGPYLLLAHPDAKTAKDTVAFGQREAGGINTHLPRHESDALHIRAAGKQQFH
jgi:hypothetical protein